MAKKIIDIDEETKKLLHKKAIDKRLSLKKYIETILYKIARK